MSAPTVWCPSCGAEYTAGSRYCSDCRVALVTEAVDPPAARGNEDGEDNDDATDLVEMGEYPRLTAQILRRRLESAGVSVLVEWTGPGADAEGTILVPDAQAEFAEAVINEIEVDDEVPDTSPEAYIIRIEEHLSLIGALLDELRTRLESNEDGGS
jgi:multidrug efflux pump subunit AcrA (membrane-fusion protein)